MFTDVVSAMEGMTELHKMERGGEGERGFCGRALALPTRARPFRFTMRTPRRVATKGFVGLRKSRLPSFVNSAFKFEKTSNIISVT